MEIGSYQPKQYDIPIISIGNITVGGTGKTPHTEWLIRLLQNDFSIATLSRGYKRKTKGVVMANQNSTASDLGDEPMQMHEKFADVNVVVAEKRVEGVEAILNSSHATDVILMDDAYQHRYVKPGFSILIMDYNRPLWKDTLLPAGELRECASGKKRADVIMVSKCDAAMSEQEQAYFIKKLKPKAHQSVYFSAITYQQLKPVFGNEANEPLNKSSKVLLVTGIAKPQPVFKYLQQQVKQLDLLSFPDHHHFSADDIEKIRQRWLAMGKDASIVTTEKDAVRLKSILSHIDGLRKVLYYLPIEIILINDKQEQLKSKIFRYVNENKRSGSVH